MLSLYHRDCVILSGCRFRVYDCDCGRYSSTKDDLSLMLCYISVLSVYTVFWPLPRILRSICRTLPLLGRFISTYNLDTKNILSFSFQTRNKTEKQKKQNRKKQPLPAFPSLSPFIPFHLFFSHRSHPSFPKTNPS